MCFPLLGALVVSIVMQDGVVISCLRTPATDLSGAISCSKALTIRVVYRCFFRGPLKGLTLVWNGHLSCGGAEVESCARAWLPASRAAEAVRNPGCGDAAAPAQGSGGSQPDWNPFSHGFEIMLLSLPFISASPYEPYQFSHFCVQARTEDCG